MTESLQSFTIKRRKILQIFSQLLAKNARRLYKNLAEICKKTLVKIYKRILVKFYKISTLKLCKEFSYNVRYVLHNLCRDNRLILQTKASVSRRPWRQRSAGYPLKRGTPTVDKTCKKNRCAENNLHQKLLFSLFSKATQRGNF